MPGLEEVRATRLCLPDSGGLSAGAGAAQLRGLCSPAPRDKPDVAASAPSSAGKELGGAKDPAVPEKDGSGCRRRPGNGLHPRTSAAEAAILGPPGTRCGGRGAAPRPGKAWLGARRCQAEGKRRQRIGRGRRTGAPGTSLALEAREHEAAARGGQRPWGLRRRPAAPARESRGWGSRPGELWLRRQGPGGAPARLHLPGPGGGGWEPRTAPSHLPPLPEPLQPVGGGRGSVAGRAAARAAWRPGFWGCRRSPGARGRLWICHPRGARVRGKRMPETRAGP